MKKIFLFISFLLISISLFSQTFYTYYASASNESMRSIIEYRPKEYISVGINNNDHYRGAILKINNYGEIEKELIIDSLDLRLILSQIQKTDTNEFVLIGELEREKFIFFGIDTELNILWQNEFKFELNDDSSYVWGRTCIDSLQNIYIPGYRGITGSYNIPFIYKFNSKGEKISYIEYPGLLDGYTVMAINNSLIMQPDGNNIFMLIDNYACASLVCKLKSNLEFDTIVELNQNTVDYTSNIFGKFDKNSNLFLTASADLEYGNYQFSIIKSDTNLNIQNILGINYSDYNMSTHNVFHSLDFFNNNFIYSITDYGIVNCIDTNLDLKWQKQIELRDSFLYGIHGIYATSDKGAIVLLDGITDNNLNTSIIKIDSLGNLPLNIQEKYNIKTTDFSVFPNPATDYIKVFKAIQVKKADFVLYNSLGQIVLQETLTENITELQIATLPKGLYIYNILQNNEVVEEGKIIKE